MNKSQALGLAVLCKTIEGCWLVVWLEQVTVLAEMRVSVGVANEGVLETVCFLDRPEPCVELLGFSDSCRKTAVISALASCMHDMDFPYIRGQGARRMICSQTAPPSC